jgi:hypothetical protein
VASRICNVLRPTGVTLRTQSAASGGPGCKAGNTDTRSPSQMRGKHGRRPAGVGVRLPDTTVNRDLLTGGGPTTKVR